MKTVRSITRVAPLLAIVSLFAVCAPAVGEDPNAKWADLIERLNGQLNLMSQQTQKSLEHSEALKKSMDSQEATTAEIFKKILERVARQDERLAQSERKISELEEKLHSLEANSGAKAW